MDVSIDLFGVEDFEIHVDDTSIGESCDAFLDSTTTRTILRDKNFLIK